MTNRRDGFGLTPTSLSRDLPCGKQELHFYTGEPIALSDAELRAAASAEFGTHSDAAGFVSPQVNASYSCCCHEDRWYLTFDVNVHVWIFVLKENDPSVFFATPYESLVKHERCHADDMLRGVRWRFFHQSETSDSYASKAACDHEGGLLKSFVRVAAIRGTLGSEGAHTGTKWKEGGECYALVIQRPGL